MGSLPLYRIWDTANIALSFSDIPEKNLRAAHNSQGRGVHAKYDWTTGVPDNGSEGEEVPRRTLLAPLASPCFVLCLIGVATEGLLDFEGKAGITSIVRWNLRPVIFSGKEKAHKHNQIFPVTARVGGGFSRPGGQGSPDRVARGLPTGGQGSKVYVLCAERKEHTFSSGYPAGRIGYPAGRIGDRGDREIIYDRFYVPNVYVPFPAPIFEKILPP